MCSRGAAKPAQGHAKIMERLGIGSVVEPACGCAGRVEEIESDTPRRMRRRQME